MIRCIVRKMGKYALITEEDTDRPTSITVYPNPPDNFNDDCVNGKLKNKVVKR